METQKEDWQEQTVNIKVAPYFYMEIRELFSVNHIDLFIYDQNT